MKCLLSAFTYSSTGFYFSHQGTWPSLPSMIYIFSSFRCCIRWPKHSFLFSWRQLIHNLRENMGFLFILFGVLFFNPLKYLSKASRALKCIISAVALFPVIFFSLFLQLVLFSLVILLLLAYIYTFQTWLLFPPFSMPLLVFHRVISFVVETFSFFQNQKSWLKTVLTKPT